MEQSRLLMQPKVFQDCYWEAYVTTWLKMAGWAPKYQGSYREGAAFINGLSAGARDATYDGPHRELPKAYTEMRYNAT